MTTDRTSYWELPTRFKVKGKSCFPIDMLRHDQCWPVDGDFQVIATRTNYEAEVVLCSHKRRLITPARWASFGWVVTEIDGEEVIS